MKILGSRPNKCRLWVQNGETREFIYRIRHVTHKWHDCARWEREREREELAVFLFFNGGFNFCLGSDHTANALLSKVQLGALTWNLPPLHYSERYEISVFLFFFLIFSNLLNSFSWNMFFEFVTDRFSLSAVLDLLTTYIYLFSRLAYISLSKWKNYNYNWANKTRIE